VGTWGTGIFDNDDAADVRDEWREALLDGLDPEAATARVLERLRVAFEDPDDQIVVWLALAAAQSQTGRLLPEVRDRALAIIEAGGDLARWADENPAAAKRRAKVLERLVERLRGPQRPPTKLRRPPVRTSPLAVGDVVHIRGREGEGLFVVVDIAPGYPPGSTEPVVATLLWEGGPFPSRDEMARLPLLLDDRDDRRGPRLSLTVAHTATRGRTALANFGKVVERGVGRPDVDVEAEKPYNSYATWLFLSKWVGGPWFRRCVELTRRLAGERA
jgi:Domain of unknown function (DUF4259)